MKYFTDYEFMPDNHATYPGVTLRDRQGERFTFALDADDEPILKLDEISPHDAAKPET